MYQATEDCSGSDVFEENRTYAYEENRTYASVYQQLFMEIRDRYLDYIPVYTDGSRGGNYVACATVVLPDTVISMRVSDSASIQLKSGQH